MPFRNIDPFRRQRAAGGARPARRSVLQRGGRAEELVARLRLRHPELAQLALEHGHEGFRAEEVGIHIALGRQPALQQLKAQAAMGIGAVAGTVLGALTGALPVARSLLDPTLQALRAIPSLAWVPLLLLWLGIDESPKITLIAIGVFFPVYLNFVSGIHNVDRKLVEVGDIHGLTDWRLIARIFLPASLPNLFTGLRTGLSLAWMFLVAAELIAATKGLGYLLTDGRETGRADLVIVAIVVPLNVVFGVVTALVRVRGRFPGRRLLSGIVDLPFAVSPIVVGVSLIMLWGVHGWFGGIENTGIKVIFGLPGMVIATLFVTLPFVVREVEPVLHEIGTEQEQAAASDSNWKRWGLWLVLLMGVGLLTLMAVSLLRRPGAE